MSSLSELLALQGRVALLGLFALVGVAIVLLVIQSVRLGRLMADYRALMTGVEGEDLHAAIQKHLKEVRALTRRVSNLERSEEKLALEGAAHLQRVGLVRYNAFPDTGSNQSFSLALLDAGGNGIVLTSLYGRSESRIFAKPVLAGKSEYSLSDEEREAVRQAMAALPELTRPREEMAAAEWPAPARNSNRTKNNNKTGQEAKAGTRRKRTASREGGDALPGEGESEEKEGQ